MLEISKVARFFIVTVLEMIYMVEALKSRYPPYYNGTCKLPSLCTGAILNNLCNSKTQEKFCVDEFNINSTGLFTLDEFLYVAKNNKRIQSIYKYIITPDNNYMNCFQKAAYLAQLAFESLNFMNDEEVGKESYFNMYENRTDLGNTKAGDGRKYRGRGFIQITGRANYAAASAALGIDLIKKPELAAFPSVAGRIAAWYWSNKNLNALSDGTFYSFIKQTKVINGGLNGLDDRTLLFEKVVNKLNCGKITKGHGMNCKSKNGKRTGYCKPMCSNNLKNKEYCGCKGKTESNLCPNDPSIVKCCFDTCGQRKPLAIK